MKKYLLTLLSIVAVFTACAQGNHAFSGLESVNFGTINLATPGGQTLSTDRAAAPGYFCAYYPGALYSGASDAANVNGYVKKYGNEAFTFPVGTGTDLRTLAISAPSSTSDAYATAWILGNPSGALDPTAPNAGAHSTASVTAPIISVSTVGQWDWLAISGTGAGLTITVSIPSMTTFAVMANLRLIGWNGTSWIDLSGSATASGNTENSTLSGTMVAGITAIGMGSTAYIVPLKLESFAATGHNCDAILNWKTSQELNLEKFVIEQSTDGITYKLVATVAAANAPMGMSYQTSITQPSGLVYYRLKMIDKDAAYTYSAVVSLRTSCSGNDYMTVYPNPVETGGRVFLSFSTAYRGRAHLAMTNTLGQQLLNKAVQVNAGANVIAVDMDKLAAGSYYITLISEQGEKIGSSQKIIKQ